MRYTVQNDSAAIYYQTFLFKNRIVILLFPHSYINGAEYQNATFVQPCRTFCKNDVFDLFMPTRPDMFHFFSGNTMRSLPFSPIRHAMFVVIIAVLCVAPLQAMHTPHAEISTDTHTISDIPDMPHLSPLDMPSQTGATVITTTDSTTSRRSRSRSWREWNYNSWNDDWDDLPWEIFSRTFFDTDRDFRIGIEAGVNTPALSSLTGTINPTLSLGIRFGFEHHYSNKQNPNLLLQEESGLFILSQRTQSPTNDRATAQGIQFGTFETEGLGYTIGGNSSVVFYNGSGKTWTVFEKIAPPELNAGTADPTGVLQSFETGSLRFGKTYTNGIALNLGDISITGSYDNTLVYRRHIFWQWAVSEGIETASNAVVNSLAKRIYRAQPDISPIASWIMQTALNYGWYRLRASQMNFPYNGEASLRYDAFVVRMSLKL